MKRALTITLALVLALGAPAAANAATPTPAAATAISAQSVAPTAARVAPTAAKTAAKMTSTRLNLRASNTTKSKVLTVLPKGTKVTPTSTKGSWAKVAYKGKTGWVHTDYLKKVSTKSAAKTTASKVATPSQAKAIAKKAVAKRGWSTKQYSCLVKLWSRESGWRVKAANSSGAYGIPQALPGSKMKSKGSDWRTSAETQISWGLSYIKGRYSNPCKALSHSDRTGWY